jgi:type II secretory pathway component GspD/PulD (secretin)
LAVTRLVVASRWLRVPVFARSVVVSAALAGWLTTVDCLTNGQVQAADPAFVGGVALALDGDVAKQLGLSPEVLEKLQAIADQRENQALELALKIKDLPADQQALELKPFVAESEKLGLALLTDEQRLRLSQIRVQRAGLSSLGDPAVAERVGLSEEQRQEVARLLQSRTVEMARGTTAERELAKAKYERDLASKLSKEQRVAWDQLAGLAPVTVAQTPEGKPADAKPADAKPTDSTQPESAKPMTTATTPASKPGDAGTSKPAAVAVAPGDRRLKFNFRFAPWKDVLDWFATQADLSLILDSPPPGTFNYTDTRSYTPEEAIDLINGVLLTKGYVLIRRERLVLLLNLEDELPDPIIELVTPEELDKRGRFELVRCLFPIKKLTPEEAEKEISKLVGPQGKVMPLAQSKQLLIRETAGRLRAIRDLIAAVEDPEANRNDRLTVIQLKNVTTDELLIAARPLLGLPDNLNSAPDGSIRVSPDALNSRLLVSGKPDRVEKLEEIAKLLDVPSDKMADAKPVEQPQLEIYPTGGADSNAVLLVMQTLLAGQTDVRLAVDPKTGNLVALATPTQHATIRATLTEMQKDASDIEVFVLRRADPQTVMVAINKLFGGDEKGAGAGAPKVESDSTTRQLFVRGTPAQITQVRSLLEKMGEGDTVTPGEEISERGNVRTIPLSGRAAETVLQQIETLWPTVRTNRIRIVRPAGDTSAPSAFKVRKHDTETPLEETPRTERALPKELQELRQLLGPDFPLEDFLPREGFRGPAKPAPATPSERVKPTPSEGPSSDKASEKPSDKPSTPPASPKVFPPMPRNAQRGRLALDQLVAWQNPQAPTGATQPTPTPGTPTPGTPTPGTAAPGTPAPGTPLPGTPTPPASGEAKPAPKKYIPPIRVKDAKKSDDPNEEPAEIVITVQPGGIVIASRDTEALDAIESLFATLGDGVSGAGGKEFTVFYLKYASAPVAGALIQEILAGGGADDLGGGGGGGGGLLGDLASGMMGDMGGGLLGGLLGGLGGGGGGGGGGLSSGGPITITSDARLNALFVKASAADIDLIQELLGIIDREAGPEKVQTSAPPRFIPVFNSSAEEVATVVRQQYANRLVADANQQRQPSPEDLVRALRGGGGGRGGRDSRTDTKSEPPKITIGVDTRSNSLIVSAPEPVFQEIKTLVEQLDAAAESNRDDTMKIVTLKSANPALVQRALSTITAGKAKSAAATTPGAAGAAGQPGAAPAGPPAGFQPQQMQDEIRRRIESFNSQQGGGGGRGGGFPGGGGGFPGGGGGRRGR